MGAVAMLLSFILGVFVFPIVYACTPPLITRLSRKQRVVGASKPHNEVDDQLKQQIAQSLSVNTNIAWVNVFLQRIYSEMIKNFAYEMRIKNAIIKSFISATKTGLVKNVRIVSIDFGTRAPYFTNVRILQPGELQRITERKEHTTDEECLSDFANFDIADLERAQDGESDNKEEVQETECLKDEKTGTVPISGLFKHKNRTSIDVMKPDNGGDNNDRLLSFTAENSSTSTASRLYDSPTMAARPCAQQAGSEKVTVDAKPPVNDAGLPLQIEFINEPEAKEGISNKTAEAIYNELIYLIGVEYSDRCKVSLEIEFPRLIYVNTTVTIGEFKGDILLRMPAEHYTTRYEYTFARDPGFIITAESGINSGRKGKRALFQNSINRFLRRIVNYTLQQTVVYPNWFQHYQGYLPSARDVEHKISKITIENIASTEKIVETVLTYVNNDFKIVSNTGGIYYCQSNHLINTSHRIKLVHFELPAAPNMADNEEFIVFEGLAVHESKLLNKFLDLSILQAVVSRFQGLQELFTKRSYSLVTLRFVNRSYDFIRAVYKNYLIFQRNDAFHPDFFIFTITNHRLQIFSYNTCPEYDFSARRVWKLHNKLHDEPMAIWGSSVLYRMMHFTKRTGQWIPPQATRGDAIPDEDQASGSNDISAEDTPGQPEENTPEALKKLFCNALATQSELLTSRVIAHADQKATIMNCIKNDAVRMRIFSDSGSIRGITNVADKIRTILLDKQADSGTNSEIQSIAVHTYTGEDFVVDICPGQNTAIIYHCEPVAPSTEENEQSSDQHSYAMKLVFRGDSFVIPSRFVEAVHLRVSHERFLGLAEEVPIAIGKIPFIHEQRIRTGAVYFEFYAEKDDDFQVRLTSCKTATDIFKLNKVVSRQVFRVLIPTPNDYIRINVTSRHGRNKFIRYRVLDMHVTRDTFVEGCIGLAANAKFKFPIKGFPTHVIFWEREKNTAIRSFLEDYETRNMIGVNGIVRAECRNYCLYYQNKARERQNVQLLLGMVYKQN